MIMNVNTKLLQLQQIGQGYTYGISLPKRFVRLMSLTKRGPCEMQDCRA